MEDEKTLSEQQIIFMFDGYGMDVIGAKGFASLFHCSYYNLVTILSLFILAHSYDVKFQLVRKFSSLDMTVVFLIYMKKIVFINSDSNQEEIR